MADTSELRNGGVIANPHKPRKVAVIYTHFPHYRAAIFSKLKGSERYSFSFYYDARGIDPTIVSGAGDDGDIQTRSYQWGPFTLQPDLLRQVLKGRIDAWIFLGNPYILTNWLYAIILRLRGRKVLMWTHGWIRAHEGLKGTIRSLYYRLAHMLLLYGDGAREIGRKKGFAPERLVPIYNSLDYERQKQARLNFTHTVSRERATFLCVSRLVQEVRVDLAIEAIALLRRSGEVNARLIVIGDGPLRAHLVAFAAELSARVDFVSALYDEDQLARYFLTATAVVSPGKVGLLAMHALAYGAPVITHDAFDSQMPEVEALRPGSTGEFFTQGSAQALADSMARLIRRSKSKEKDAEREAIAMIEGRYTPQIQCMLIENALDALFGSRAV